jgi:hypothetical protein
MCVLFECKAARRIEELMGKMMAVSALPPCNFVCGFLPRGMEQRKRLPSFALKLHGFCGACRRSF